MLSRLRGEIQSFILLFVVLTGPKAKSFLIKRNLVTTLLGCPCTPLHSYFFFPLPSNELVGKAPVSSLVLDQNVTFSRIGLQSEYTVLFIQRG